MRGIVLILSMAVFQTAFAQLEITTTSNISALQMIKTLEGPGVKFSNIDVSKCPSIAIGLFDATFSNAGIDSGVILSTGNVLDAIGPNNDPGFNVNGITNGFQNDSDLVSIVGVNTYDGCIIEFDLQMSGDTLRFNYVFASEEYPEYAPPNSSINDVFGFFISGPGIMGTFSNNAENIALLPDGITPISINNINAITNEEYFIDNGDGDSPPQNTDETIIQYDGFTVKLTAQIPVVPCEVYHLKLAISDAFDNILNSAVFFENGSFVSSEINYSNNFRNVYEGCTEGGVTFFRKDFSNQDTINMYFSFGGTATNGTDYGVRNSDGSTSPFPSGITLLPNTNDTTLFIVGFQNFQNDDDRTIVIYLLIDDCFEGKVIADSIVLNLRDEIYVDLLPDTLVCVGEPINIALNFDIDISSKNALKFSLNSDLTWDKLLSNSVYKLDGKYYFSDSLIRFSALQDSMITIFISDTFGCVGMDTLYYSVLPPKFVDFTYEYTNIQDPRQINFVNLSQYPAVVTYRWEFNDASGSISTETNPSHYFEEYGTYWVKLYAEGPGVIDCPMIKEVVIREFEIPNIITPNGDGLNDYFILYGIVEPELKIFNRWGKNVYFSEKYNNDFDAEGLSDGMYHYIITFRSGIRFKGWLQISR